MVTELALLSAWESGYGRPAPDRAVTLAAAASGLPLDEVADLPLGACDRLLLELREQCFGARLDGLARCPQCDTELDVGMDVDELRADGADGGRTVEVAGRTVTLRPLTSRDLGSCGGDRDRLLARCLIDEPSRPPRTCSTRSKRGSTSWTRRRPGRSTWTARRAQRAGPRPSTSPSSCGARSTASLAGCCRTSTRWPPRTGGTNPTCWPSARPGAASTCRPARHEPGPGPRARRLRRAGTGTAEAAYAVRAGSGAGQRTGAAGRRAGGRRRAARPGRG